MQITVFGASGKVGRCLVSRLLGSGHDVVVFVHRSNPLRAHPRLSVAHGDVHDAAAVGKVLEGSEAVISTLGSWGTPTKDIVSSAMRSILPAMEKHGIVRIITLTGAAAASPGGVPSWSDRLQHAAAMLVAPRILRDSEDHLRQLQSSAADWTVIRSPVMRSWGPSGRYVASRRPPMPWQTVHRDDVVSALVGQLDDAAWSRSAPYLNDRA